MIGTSALIDRVYAAHPWFTMNSESVHKRRVNRPTAAPAVYTVGYEGIMVDGLPREKPTGRICCSGLASGG